MKRAMEASGGKRRTLRKRRRYNGGRVNHSAGRRSRWGREDRTGSCDAGVRVCSVWWMCGAGTPTRSVPEVRSGVVQGAGQRRWWWPRLSPAILYSTQHRIRPFRHACHRAVYRSGEKSSRMEKCNRANRAQVWIAFGQMCGTAEQLYVKMLPPASEVVISRRLWVHRYSAEQRRDDGLVRGVCDVFNSGGHCSEARTT